MSMQSVLAFGLDKADLGFVLMTLSPAVIMMTLYLVIMCPRKCMGYQGHGMEHQEHKREGRGHGMEDRELSMEHQEYEDIVNERIRVDNDQGKFRCN